MLVLSESSREKWVSVEVGSGQSFDILVRRPSFAQQTESLTSANRAAYHIESAVVSWRGVKDAGGAEIPFCTEKLKMLCERFPPAFLAILRVANDAFYGMSEEQEKN